MGVVSYCQHPSIRKKCLKATDHKDKKPDGKKAKTETAKEKDFEYWYVECSRIATERSRSYK
jgi:hypothetical protein